jgi:site-specific recombinase XerC
LSATVAQAHIHADSYAYSFQSLFEFASQKLKAAPSVLMLEQLDAALISSFLEHLETTRGNSAETRNIRWAAIRSFFRFLQHREQGAVEQVRCILAIPFKRTDTRLVPYLVQKEMQALLDAPDPATRQGTRDRAMLQKLNATYVRPGFQQLHSVGVPQGMRAGVLLEAGTLAGLSHGIGDRIATSAVGRDFVRGTSIPRAVLPPIAAQQFQ